MRSMTDTKNETADTSKPSRARLSVAIRIDAPLLARVDAIVSALAERSAPFPAPDRSDVMRSMLSSATDAFEAKLGIKPPTPPAGGHAKGAKATAASKATKTAKPKGKGVKASATPVAAPSVPSEVAA